MLQIKSKFKIGKRLGAGVFEQCQSQRFVLSEARSGRNKRQTRGRRGGSDYGAQLIEKQKMRYTYGLSEKQFSRYVKEAIKTTDPAATLFKMLEMRLDNAVYRAGLASTRRAARQMVSHGHILVNGRRMTIASHQLRKGDKIAIREASKDSVLFTAREEGASSRVPWIAFDHAAGAGEIAGEPTFAAGEVLLDFPAVFEFYSR